MLAYLNRGVNCNECEVEQQRGNVRFLAPELFLACGAHSYASDFWGLGCLLFLMKTGRLPFEADFHPSSSQDKEGGEDDDAHINLDAFIPMVHLRL